MTPITITETGGRAMIEGDSRLLQLIVRSAKADIDAMSMNKGSAEYRAVYGALSLALGQASPWPEHGKVADSSEVIRLLHDDESVTLVVTDASLLSGRSLPPNIVGAVGLDLDDMFA